MKHVDIGIPTNKKGKHNISCLFWMLSRMVLQMQGTIAPGRKWDVMVKSSLSQWTDFIYGLQIIVHENVYDNLVPRLIFIHFL